ncbi:SIMPL domain-containing protein [Candidatus Parcubacteria bacterium]|nr:SIMPL domain-containing protein [Candidatus Parcubacteria bacterium]
MEEESKSSSVETSHSLDTTHTLDLTDNLYRVLMVAVAAMVLFFLGQLVYQFSSLPGNTPHEIQVSGQGRAFGKPDVATVSFGVTTQALKSQDAVNKNNEAMNKIITAIKASGVEDKDIQTIAYNLSPQYDYPRILTPSKPNSAGTVSSPTYVQGGRVFSGYSLNQQVMVKIRSFDKISEVLDKATSNGATDVSDLQFKIDDPEKVQAEARAMAIEDAQAKLKDITHQSGLRAGKLVNISEGYNNYPMPSYAPGAEFSKDAANVAPTIASGQQEVNSTVTLTYQVK